MTKVQKFLTGCLALVLAAATFAAPLSYAAASQQIVPPNFAGTDHVPPGVYPSLEFVGLDHCLVTGTADQLCATGPGILMAICPDNAATGYSEAFDTGVAINAIGTQYLGLISPTVYSANNTTSLGQGGPCWIPTGGAGIGARFKTALHGINSASGIFAHFYFLTDVELAPGN